MAYNKTEHLRRNIDAIRTAFLLEKEGRTATEAEQEILRSYSGFGAIKEVLEELPLKRQGVGTYRLLHTSASYGGNRPYPLRTRDPTAKNSRTQCRCRSFCR